MPDTNQAAEVVSAIKRQPKQTAPTSSDGETPRTTETTRQDAHFTLQAKGGIGKSFVAWVLAQWHMERGLPVASFDTDPGNATFEAFEAFKVQHVSILDDDQINVDGMDGLIEGIIAAHFGGTSGRPLRDPKSGISRQASVTTG